MSNDLISVIISTALLLSISDSCALEMLPPNPKMIMIANPPVKIGATVKNPNPEFNLLLLPNV